MGKNTKKRNWGFFVYPSKEYLDSIGTTYDGADGYGSAPENWKELLQQTGLQCAISPLHDKDELEDGSGRTKKPHWHVIACYSGPTSFNVVKKLTDQLNSPAPQALEQIRGYYRYLTHKDNPEKAQYDELNIQTINGFNIADFVDLTRSEISQIKKSLQVLIRQLDITEYAHLMDYLLDSEMSIEHEVASNHTYFFDKYISSRRNYALRYDIDDESLKHEIDIENQHAINTQEHETNTQNVCPECDSEYIVKCGKTQAGSQRWKCQACQKIFVLK